jgi:hypothetical protein
LRHRREALLNALADDDQASTSSPDVALARATPAAQLDSEFEPLHGHRPPSRHPDYLRRRVAWAVQAAKLDGLPKPISGRVVELKEHLPERWKDAFLGVARVHVTRLHRVEQRRAFDPAAAAQRRGYRASATRSGVSAADDDAGPGARYPRTTPPHPRVHHPT